MDVKAPLSSFSAWPEADLLVDASSLLSSRWPKDNPVTSDPSCHYTGAVSGAVTIELLQQIVHGEFGARLGLEVDAVKMGVFTWDLCCQSVHGPVLVQIPRTVDEPSPSGRQKLLVPERSEENMDFFRGRRLDRYLAPALALGPVSLQFPVHVLPLDLSFRSATFGDGQVRLDVRRGSSDWKVGLGPNLTADALVEMVAAVAYHYEPEEEGGTTIADLSLNDGDFSLKRRRDGSLSLRLNAIRRRETEVSPERLIVHLAQLAAFQSFAVGDEFVSVPTLASNPAIAFEGYCRGRRYRALDLGEDAIASEKAARACIAGLPETEDGASFEPWVRRFLDGSKAASFGTGSRERWWRLHEIEARTSVARLRADFSQDPAEQAKAQVLEDFVKRMERRVGHLPWSQSGLNWNDLNRGELERLLEEAGEEANRAQRVLRAWMDLWPYLDLEQMLSEVQEGESLRRINTEGHFGTILRASEEALTWRQANRTPRRASPLANIELFEAKLVPPKQIAAALESCLTFENYMDAALHDPSWGYYGRHVEVDDSDHFPARSEKFSPDYGRWLAGLAFNLYRSMRARGELRASDPFPIVEFGAGTGRGAFDLLAAARCANPAEPGAEELWGEFAEAVSYRIYERNALLREKQKERLGASATIKAGDVRFPEESLGQDFPQGLKGLVLARGLLDTLGVHKLVFTREGEVFAALVLPSLSDRGAAEASADLAGRIAQSDAIVRARLSFVRGKGRLYLDGPTFSALMCELAQFPRGERARRTLQVRCEELYVPARSLRGLSEHLRGWLEAAAFGLARIDTGAVLYANLHADRFVQAISARLSAGFVVTLDHGASAARLFENAARGAFLFRTLSEGTPFAPISTDPYVRIGLQELTSDVNFTALAMAGKKAGLEPLHYGSEHDILGGFLPEILSRSGEASIKSFLGSDSKLLVQSPRPSVLSLPHARGLDLFSKPGELSDDARSRFKELRARLDGEFSA